MTGAISNAKIIKALKETHSNYTMAAKTIGCSRETIRLRVDKSPELQKIVHDEREGMVDHAESALYSSILNKDPWAVQFTLKTRGKNRGYVERVEQEITGKDGGPIRIVKAEELTDDELANIATAGGK